MTEEQWNKAHWNEGEGENLPYNCLNKYLQLNGGGKKQWNKERSANAEFNYTLRFEIAENKALPDEDKTIGKDWLMKFDNNRSGMQEPLLCSYRKCGSVYIGVLASPENTDFSFDMFGDRINNIEQPKHSEYRGIYGVKLPLQ